MIDGTTLNYKYPVNLPQAMPPEGKTGLTINDATFEELRDGKPDGVTWDRYLLDLKAAAEGPGAERDRSRRRLGELLVDDLEARDE